MSQLSSSPIAISTQLLIAVAVALGASGCTTTAAVSAAAPRVVIAPPAPATALPPLPVREAKWNGYTQLQFSIGGHGAYVVVPALPAPANPWIWRTAWPDYHFEVDLELARCGYHIGYIDVVDMLGSDASLDLMDQFYAQVRSQWALAEKPAIEPNSRGGLHAYRYAARHPERVACILGDVPVMDFKSWPLGHPGSLGNWSQVIAGYGFKSDAEAMAYSGNPIDLLAPIAKAKIPLRHTICLTDQVVPPEQNTLEAKRRLQSMGWDLEVVAVAQSNDCEGHHFPFPEAHASTRFVMDHADVQPAAGVEYFQLRDGLANSRAQFEGKKAGRVAFLGGSITYNGGWRDELVDYLRKKFPETTFEFLAAGIPSVGSNGHAFRLDQDIFKDGPLDLLFVEAAVNDGGNIRGKPELMLRSMEGVVRHAREKNPQTDIVQMHFVSGEALADIAAGKTPEAVGQHERVAAHYGCVSLDLVRECADRIRAGQFTWESGFHGDVHPPAYGQRVYASSMMRMLDSGFAVSASPKSHDMPEGKLDDASYDHGHYAPLENAKLGKGFTLDPRWRPAQGETREGFADVPTLVAAQPGSEFNYEFEGRAFGLFLAAGYDTCVLEFSVDGAPFKKFDTYSQWSGSLHLPWPVMLADGLRDGKHTAIVRTTADAENRTALHVVHVLVN